MRNKVVLNEAMMISNKTVLSKAMMIRNKTVLSKAVSMSQVISKTVSMMEALIQQVKAVSKKTRSRKKMTAMKLMMTLNLKRTNH